MLLGFTASVLLVACSSSDHPPAADFAGEVPPPPIATDGGPGEPSVDAGSNPTESESCPPRTKRECMTSFKTIAGKVQSCTQSYQWCRGDGSGWHNCGFSVDKPPD